MPWFARLARTRWVVYYSIFHVFTIKNKLTKNITTMSREIGIEEVRQHTKKDSVWMVINNEVYDVTKFLAEHPGGEDTLLEAAGKDSTVAFEDVGHSSDARALMQEFKIGTLSKKDQQGSSSCYKLQWAGIALLGAIILGYALKKSLS